MVTGDEEVIFMYVNKGDAINVQLPDKVKDDEFICLKDFNGIEN